MFSDFVKISETYLAKGLNISLKETIKILKHLHELRVLIYQPVKERPQLTFVLARHDAERLPLNTARMAARKKLLIREDECDDRFCNDAISLQNADDPGLF